MRTRTYSTSLYWHTTRRNQGQIVTDSQPQIAGAAEGAEGPAKGLRLTTDASDRTWELRKGRRVVATGNLADGPAPTVAEAMALAAK